MINKSDVANKLQISLSSLGRYAKKLGVWGANDRRKKITHKEEKKLLTLLGFDE